MPISDDAKKEKAREYERQRWLKRKQDHEYTAWRRRYEDGRNAERYASDPEYRERVKRKNDAYRRSERGKEVMAAARKRWREENRDKHREQRRAAKKRRAEQAGGWYAALGENQKRKQEQRKRRRKQGMTGSHDPAHILVLFDLQDGKCAYCGREMQPYTYHPINRPHGFTRDHVLPVALGGTDDISNIKLACHPCNTLKRDRHPDEWIFG